MIIGILYWFVAAACWAYALAYGGKPSRWAFACFMMAMLGTTVATPGSGFAGVVGLVKVEAWSSVNPVLLATDTLYFLGLYAAALSCRRHWLIWSAGLQFVCVATHFGPLLDPGTNAKLYRGLETVWSIPMLATMVVGIFKDRRYERRVAPQYQPSGHRPA